MSENQFFQLQVELEALKNKLFAAYEASRTPKQFNIEETKLSWNPAPCAFSATCKDFKKPHCKACKLRQSMN